MQDIMPSGAMERGNLPLANYISIGLSVGFFMDDDKKTSLRSKIDRKGGVENDQIFLRPINNMGREGKI